MSESNASTLLLARPGRQLPSLVEAAKRAPGYLGSRGTSAAEHGGRGAAPHGGAEREKIWRQRKAIARRNGVGDRGIHTSRTVRKIGHLLPASAGALLLFAGFLALSGFARGASPKAHRSAAYNLLSRPHAAFVWLPELPHPGEPVLLASVSTDPVSPLVAFAWDLGLGDGLQAGGPALQTMFSTFAPHVVRLRVTNGSGVSDVSAETITMSTPPPTVLLPFPIIRMVAIVKPSGANVKLLAVKTGGGVQSAVTCRGKRCPARAASHVVPASRHGSVWVSFHSFQRFLPAGTVLEVRATKPNEQREPTGGGPRG